MSDRTNWIIPTALWSTCAAFQFGSALREWWTNREARQRRRQSEMSDWRKVMRGETKRGYRLWLQPRCCPYSRSKCHYYVRGPWTNNDDRNEPEEEATSIFMVFVHRMPNAEQYALVLRRYSIFSSSIYSDIAQVICRFEPMETGWSVQSFTQLDDRTVVLVFKRRTSNRICAVLVDVNEKTSRLLSITMPPGICSVMFVCRDEKRTNRLRIVYDVQEENAHEMITINYEIDTSGGDRSRLIAYEAASQSITFPGRRECIGHYVSGTFRLQSDQPNVESFVISFDHRGNYQIDTYDNWSQAFVASILGRQWIEAFIDFYALSHVIEAEGAQDSMFRGKILQVVFTDVHSPTSPCSIVQRRVDVPSMKVLAAEAICRANPSIDLSQLKAETGVDLFDGIFENREKPMPTIQLLDD